MTPVQTQSTPPAGSQPPSRIAGEDFRDHLATAEKDGTRKWIFPRKFKGKWLKRRTWFAWFLIGLMVVGPFVKIGGNPLLLINIVERKFSILGKIFWPQDMIIFTVAMLLFLTGIIVFTTSFGRLWCGWACPQTVLMEMVFRKIEYLIEGDAHAQRALASAPWSKRKVVRKASKHLIFLLLSFGIGNWLLSYIVGYEQLLAIIADPPRNHATGLAFMAGFTAIFYLIFARFREQACTFICPYGRLQSAIVDENTMVVAYDYKRGEPRGPLQRTASAPQSFGDCVSCRQCVAVCPTGIDIRNGTQMECVNCTACIDACDSVMSKVGRAPGLIRYASLNSIERGEPFRFTSRMATYSALLAMLILGFGFLIFTRSVAETTILRAPGALFQTLPDGRIANLYTLKTINKSNRDLTLRLATDKPGSKIRIMGSGMLLVPRQQMVETSLLITLAPDAEMNPKTTLKIGVYAGDKRLQTLSTMFVGPRN